MDEPLPTRLKMKEAKMVVDDKSMRVLADLPREGTLERSGMVTLVAPITMELETEELRFAITGKMAVSVCLLLRDAYLDVGRTHQYLRCCRLDSL